MNKLIAALKKMKKLATLSVALVLYLFLDAALKSIEIAAPIWLTIWIMLLLTMLIVGGIVIIFKFL